MGYARAALVASVACMTVCGCAHNAKEKQLQEFVDAHVAKVKPLAKQAALASWEAAVTGDDAAWQEETLTIAAADVPASPSVLTLVFHPKDGELGTDDFLLMPPWLEVTRKCLTS